MSRALLSNDIGTLADAQSLSVHSNAPVDRYIKNSHQIRESNGHQIMEERRLQIWVEALVRSKLSVEVKIKAFQGISLVRSTPPINLGAIQRTE